jgi:hypothetical protein
VRGVVWGVRSSISVIRRGAGRRERRSPSSLAEVVGVHPLYLVGALQRDADAVVDHEVGERLPVDQDHLVRYPAHYLCSTPLSSRNLSNFACSFSACSSLPYLSYAPIPLLAMPLVHLRAWGISLNAQACAISGGVQVSKLWCIMRLWVKYS